MSAVYAKLRAFVADRDGSVTIESTLVMPLVLLCTIAMIVFNLRAFREGAIGETAGTVADRTAFTWHNEKTAMKGLYDVSGIIQTVTGSTVTIQLPYAPNADTDSAAQRSLARFAALLPEGVPGTIGYTSGLLDRNVTVALQAGSAGNTAAARFFPERPLTASVSSQVRDPAEWIRTVDLVRSYVPRLIGLFKPGEAEQTIRDGSAQAEERTPEIRSEKEAKAYIQRLVGGRSTTFDTEQTGEYRKVDALDRDGVAHEAKYTVNKTDAKAQIAKDVELMRKGVVKGVVWHFFRNKKTGLVDLPYDLRHRLEAAGIVVIIHD